MKKPDRREFIRKASAAACGIVTLNYMGGPFLLNNKRKKNQGKLPSILLVNGDDWGWPFCGAYGDKVVRTPSFDRIAREGALFTNAFCSAPSSTASRGATLTGRMFYLLEQGSVLYGPLPSKFPVYPDILESKGYIVGSAIKGWGPGNAKDGGWEHQPAGKSYPDFKTFMKDVPDNKSFCFWLGPITPHRPFPKGSGEESGLKPADVSVPPMFADSPDTRTDILDYYRGIELADKVLGDALDLIDSSGRYEDTVVIVTGDNGMAFPRAKSNLYDRGVHIPLAIRWPEMIVPGRVVEDFISHCDIAPTILEIAGLPPEKGMTGKSFINVLKSRKSGSIDKNRNFIITGLESHNPREYFPMRSIRNKKYSYIHNYKPGVYTVCDSGPALNYMIQNKEKPSVGKIYNTCFGERPAEELYDLTNDPFELNNLAGDPGYSEIKDNMRTQLQKYLVETSDPRSIGEEHKFDQYVEFVKNRPPFNTR